jgi:hypothetical protein
MKRIRACIFLVLAFGFSFACENKSTEPSRPVNTTVSPDDRPGFANAEIVQTRIVPIKTALGKPAHELLIDWKNTGTVPIFQVKARFKVFTASGVQIESFSQSSYFIFVTSNPEKAILPDQIYKEPSGSGHYLLKTPSETRIPAKAQAEIVSVSQSPPESE